MRDEEHITVMLAPRSRRESVIDTFMRGLRFQLSNPDTRVGPLRRSNNVVDWVQAGRARGAMMVRRGYRHNDPRVTQLQNEQLDLERRFPMKKGRKVPCARCEFIAFCKDTEMTCPVFRGFVGNYRPEFFVQAPDKDWIDSWPKEDEEDEDGTSKRRVQKRRRKKGSGNNKPDR